MAWVGMIGLASRAAAAVGPGLMNLGRAMAPHVVSGVAYGLAGGVSRYAHRKSKRGLRRTKGRRRRW